MSTAPAAAVSFVAASASVQASLGDRLEQLAKLHDQGALTDSEYEDAKSKVLADGGSA